MEAYASARPQDLPYGLQRRVEIARALATKPSVLLLDEPMAGMSLPDRNDIATLLEELRASELTLLLVEHDLAMIHRVCDSAYALDFGRVIASGPSRSVAAEPIVREAYLGKASEEGDENGAA
jgi:branched-chain amino acid transport system ATP-binding protein